MGARIKKEINAISKNPMFPAFTYLIVLGIALIILF